MSDAVAAQSQEEPSEPAEVAAIHPWTQVPYERSKLLRLAPLPADRYTGLRPIKFAQLSSVERHSESLSYLRLHISLPDQSDRDALNTLEVWLDHQAQQVRFGPDEGLHTEPCNRGLGRFLLAHGISWAQQHAEQYKVQSVLLSARDVLTDDARDRRDQALQAQGFSVDYPEENHHRGRCRANSISELKGDWYFEKVQELTLMDAAAMLKQADTLLREQDVKLREKEEKIAQLKREDGTLRFSIACLVAFCAFQAGLLIWIAAR